ncbi:MAG: Crp/Fnr family transcriptional regulator [Betaproteobacteria bacterium]|nr:Crp/Fnr family transcriptional regulator [Betaproteobacteria bacterium]
MPINLKNIPLFRDLQKDDLDAIAQVAVVKSFPKNGVVITEGEFTRSLYVILSGKVKVYLDDKNGKELVLDVKGPGEYFGEMVLDEGPRSASVVTTEPCRFAVISTTEFKNLLLKHPQLALHVLENLIHMVRGLNEHVRSLALLDVYGRVARMLLDLAVEQGGNHVIPEKLTQQEMASRVGASREMINRILRDLATGGYIRVEGKRIIITNIAAFPRVSIDLP